MITPEQIPIYAMAVSLMALLSQLIFGWLGLKRAKAETERQMAETRKQEAILALHTEEGYKQDVRDWGLAVLDSMARAQQLCTIDPSNLDNSDFDIERANTVAALRSLLNRAKWLFPNLAVPSREDAGFSYTPERNHSALEAILHAYHTLDKLQAADPEQRKTSIGRIRRFRNEFIKEMRQAVDPKARGADIEALVAQVHQGEKEREEEEE
jgi:hypothetical protein